MLLRKPKAPLEVYNDKNAEIVNVFKVLRDKEKAKELEHGIKYTPWSRDEFELSHKDTDSDIERARRTIARAYIGYGSNGANRKEQSTGFRQRVDLVFSNFSKAIASFTERLSDVVIENRCYSDLLEQLDSEETLFYLDPPYVPSSRGDALKDRYVHDLNEKDHESLCESVCKLKGMVIISGYPNPIYDSLGWESIQTKTNIDSGTTGDQERTEVLWISPRAARAHKQMAFF